MESGTGCGRVMAGLFLLPRAARRPAFWPRELRRGALLLGVSAALFWSSFAIGRWIVFFPESGPIYVDLLLGWIAVILHVSAWPNLWVGLRDLRGDLAEPWGDRVRPFVERRAGTASRGGPWRVCAHRPRDYGFVYGILLAGPIVDSAPDPVVGLKPGPVPGRPVDPAGPPVRPRNGPSRR